MAELGTSFLPPLILAMATTHPSGSRSQIPTEWVEDRFEHLQQSPRQGAAPNRPKRRAARRGDLCRGRRIAAPDFLHPENLAAHKRAEIGRRMSLTAGNGWPRYLANVYARIMDAQTPALRALMRFYEAEARYSASGVPADRAALLETLHPDIVLHQPDSLPYGGQWRGREEFGRWIDSFVETWVDIKPTDPVFHTCGDDIVVCTVTMRATARSTGALIDMPMCQVIRIAADQPVEWRNFAWDTAIMLKALGGSV
ncbi:ketosteroid isomerase-like protein [Bradyrhizobium sp. USDA 4369]|uniref:nuclear transport factor 2 family protein n=1 Tax=Caulobacter sp. SSI4214 TaxID=2575739 RepID=UPI00143C3233|nr:nuclear transport factor 2 family protein [Caulobacter sp. SSI4214]